jgi:hypothetical protein
MIEKRHKNDLEKTQLTGTSVENFIPRSAATDSTSTLTLTLTLTLTYISFSLISKGVGEAVFSLLI